jgi:tRNA pseudouridine38-40 synthase
MPPAPRLALRLAYLGGDFLGWQRQPHGRTVQSEVETALARLYGVPVTVRGAGRTDAGVHAAGQVAHLDPPLAIPPRGVREALNTLLPSDVRVRAVRVVARTFDARASARAKQYRYRLAWGDVLEPWEALRTHWIATSADVAAIEATLAYLVGTHDFAAFALSGHAGTGRRGTVRTMISARAVRRGRRLAVVFIGDGFLRGMVRRIVGALLEVGRGAQSAIWVDRLLREPGTRPPAPTAPAHGLTLERVLY